MYSTIDLETLRWCGDSDGDMQKFLNTLGYLKSGLKPSIPRSEITEVVLDRMGSSQILENQINRYKDKCKE